MKSERLLTALRNKWRFSDNFDPALQATVGAWRSLVAHTLGVRVVGRSNRLTPTNLNLITLTLFGFVFRIGNIAR